MNQGLLFQKAMATQSNPPDSMQSCQKKTIASDAWFHRFDDDALSSMNDRSFIPDW